MFWFTGSGLSTGTRDRSGVLAWHLLVWQRVCCIGVVILPLISRGWTSCSHTGSLNMVSSSDEGQVLRKDVPV
jgi:hypothetical protein